MVKRQSIALTHLKIALLLQFVPEIGRVVMSKNKKQRHHEQEQEAPTS